MAWLQPPNPDPNVQPLGLRLYALLSHLMCEYKESPIFLERKHFKNVFPSEAQKQMKHVLGLKMN